jgi:hypothetical protein
MRPEPCEVEGCPALYVVQGGLRIEKRNKGYKEIMRIENCGLEEKAASRRE